MSDEPRKVWLISARFRLDGRIDVLVEAPTLEEACRRLRQSPENYLEESDWLDFLPGARIQAEARPEWALPLPLGLAGAAEARRRDGRCAER